MCTYWGGLPSYYVAADHTPKHILYLNSQGEENVQEVTLQPSSRYDVG